MTMTHGEGRSRLFQPGDTSPRPCVRHPGPPPLPDACGVLAREQPPIPSWIRELYGDCRVSDSHFPHDRP